MTIETSALDTATQPADASVPRNDYSAPPQRNDYLIFFALAIPILIIDQITKFWVEANLLANVRNYVWEPFLAWSHVHNTGGTFGLFPGSTWIFAILALFVAGGLVLYNFRHPFRSRKLRVALGMVFGGALGNLSDRFRIGHVTDFIDVDVTSVVPAWVPRNIADWYIFNVADIFIIGAIIFMFYLILFDAEEIEPRSADGEPLPVPPWASLLKSADVREAGLIGAVLGAATFFIIVAANSAVVGSAIASGTLVNDVSGAQLGSITTILVVLAVLGLLAAAGYLLFAKLTEAEPAPVLAVAKPVPLPPIQRPQPSTLPMSATSAESQRKVLLIGAAIVALVLLVWQSYKEEKRANG